MTRKWRLCFLAALVAATSSQSVLAMQIAAPLVQPVLRIFHAYQGSSGSGGVGTDMAFRGYNSPLGDVVTAVPGVLNIEPGHLDINRNGVLEATNEKWRNFVRAAQPTSVSYTVKNVTLTKTVPKQVQCSEVYPGGSFIQHGTDAIRLWWPLLYEAPGTTWTLNILYGTPKLWDDDGPGPNKPGYVHCEIWTWQLDADLSSLSSVLEVFHELPFGMSETPLIGDEALYKQLQEHVETTQALLNVGDTAGAGLMLGEFELLIADSCIAETPLQPLPGGYGTGIAQTLENPVCCKLMIDAEYIGRKYGAFAASR